MMKSVTRKTSTSRMDMIIAGVPWSVTLVTSLRNRSSILERLKNRCISLADGRLESNLAYTLHVTENADKRISLVPNNFQTARENGGVVEIVDAFSEGRLDFNRNSFMIDCCVRRRFRAEDLYKIMLEYLKVICTLDSMKSGAIPLHCSVIVRGRRILVFSGPSGVGKSTIACLFQQKGWQILDDEFNCLVPNGIGGFTIRDIPRYSELRNAATIHRKACVEAVYLLRHGDLNSAIKLSGAKAVYEVLKNTMLVCPNEQCSAMLLSNAHAFSGAVPVFELSFVNNTTICSFVESHQG